MWGLLPHFQRCFVRFLPIGRLKRNDMSMTFVNTPESDWNPWRINSMSFAIAGLLLIVLLLTGCSHVSSPKKPTLNLYQSPVLRLEAGTSVQTKDGVYTAQQDEIWHSDYRYRQLELKVIDQ